MKLYGDVSIFGGEIKNLKVEILVADPTGAGLHKARLWFNSTESKFKFFDGTTIQIIGESSELTQLAADLAAEIARATAAEGVLTADLASEITARTNADSTLQGAINAEAAARAAADATLQSNIDTANTALTNEISRATTAEGNLNTAITTEATSRANADSALSSTISTEISDRIAGDAAIRTDLASNLSGKGASLIGIEDSSSLFAATTLESALLELKYDVSTLQSQTGADVTAEAAARTAADGVLQGNIDAEVTARTAADTAEASARTAGDAAVQANVDALTLQQIYDQSAAVAGVANIKMTTGKDFRITDDTDNSIYFQVDAETGTVSMTGPVSISGNLNVSGTTTTVNSTVTDADHWALTPADGLTTALTIEPDAGVVLAAPIISVKHTNGGSVDFSINAAGETSAAKVAVNGKDVETAIDKVDTHVAGTGLKHAASVITLSAVVGMSATDVQAGIAELKAGLIAAGGDLSGETSALRTFTGSTGATDTAPAYSSVQYVANGDSLTAAIGKLDAQSHVEASAIAAETAARTAADSGIQANLTQEISDRTNADLAFKNDLASTANGKGASMIGVEDASTLFTATTVEGVLAELSSNIGSAAATEAAARTAAINAEAAARTAADTAIVSDLASTATGKGATLVGIVDAGGHFVATTVEDALAELFNGAGTVAGDLATEISDRIAADTALSTSITSEQTARANADSALNAAITSEASSRISADTTLQGNIDAEQTARISADNALQALVDASAKRYQYVAGAAGTSFTVTHNLGFKYVTVTVFDAADDQVIIPNTITAVDANTLTVTFTSSVQPVVKVVA